MKHVQIFEKWSTSNWGSINETREPMDVGFAVFNQHVTAHAGVAGKQQIMKRKKIIKS